MPLSDLPAPVAVSLGAIPGALSRYYLGLFLTRKLGSQFPFGTFAVNLSGSLLMGIVATLAIERAIPANLQLSIATGFLGSYTTFSTYALDTVGLWQSSKSAALFYSIGSIGFGLLGLGFGVMLVRML
ncbi:fluoride efflux transporter CrcB [Microcoleus sp. FACHB-1515]|uniref:fluoride efflux transporter CrcB n=1 Tax=Cyanophyceae TaxID=3028117 RepID=UPI0018EFF079|nr:fluoride efflux transporter CrcB [Microcoleus sp. FACHB-1515]